MKIALIRHGKTAGNLEKRYIGRTDEPLCPEGIEGLRKIMSEGKIPRADIIFVSPMLRCLQSGEILFGKSDFIQIPELREMDFGAFEGKNYEELKNDSRYEAWIKSNGTLPFPGGESRSEFVERVMAGFNKALEIIRKGQCGAVSADILRESPAASALKAAAQAAENAGSQVDAAFVVHGGTIMAVMSSLGFGNYFDFQVQNGGGFIFDTEEKSWNII